MKIHYSVIGMISALVAEPVLAVQDFTVFMRDLPSDSPVRLMTEIDFDHGSCMAKFISTNAAVAAPGVISRPCRWMVMSGGRANALSFDHDARSVLREAVEARRRYGLPAGDMTIDGEPACYLCKPTGETNVVCSYRGSVLIIGQSEVVALAVRQCREKMGLVHDHTGTCSPSEYLHVTSTDLGGIMGRAITQFLSSVVPIDMGYDEVVHVLRRAELKTVLLSGNESEQTRLVIETTSETSADVLVKAWQKAIDASGKIVRSLDEDDRQVFRMFRIDVDPFGDLLDRTKIVRSGACIELRIDLDYPPRGSSYGILGYVGKITQAFSEAYRESVLRKNLKYKEADQSYEAVLARAEAGYSSDMCLLGSWYEGQGRDIPVKRDYEKAAEWYRKSAGKGNAWGWSKLGSCYERGFGVRKNPKYALELYRMSAACGAGAGMMNVGRCYEEGIAVKKDLSMALKWYLRAAERHNNPYGDKMNFLKLASFYENGAGLASPNPAEARRWRMKAKDGAQK